MPPARDPGDDDGPSRRLPAFVKMMSASRTHPAGGRRALLELFEASGVSPEVVVWELSERDPVDDMAAFMHSVAALPRARL